MLVFVGYRTIIARYVAKWGIARMCLCKIKYQGGGIAPFWGSANMGYRSDSIPEGPAIDKNSIPIENFNPGAKISIPIEIFKRDRTFQSRSFHLRGPRSVQKRARSKISIHDRSLEIFNPEGRDRIFSIPGPSGIAVSRDMGPLSVMMGNLPSATTTGSLIWWSRTLLSGPNSNHRLETTVYRPVEVRAHA